MKNRVITLIAAAIFACCFALNSFAYNIDGFVDVDEEWNKTTMADLADKIYTGCDVVHLYVRHDFQHDKNLLFLAIQTVENKSIYNFENCSFEITVEGIGTIKVSPAGAEYDENDFGVKSALKEHIDGVSMEAKISFKRGADSAFDLSIVANDSRGNVSVPFKIAIKDKLAQSSTTAATTTKAEAVRTTEKTTKEKTTKEKTTKEKTTKEKTTTEKTTKEKTTSEKTTKEKTTREKTTKEKTTKEKTTKQKTTKTQKTKATKSTTAPYSTVDPDDYPSRASAQGSIAQTQSGQGSESTTQEVNALAQSKNDTGRIVLKTVSACIIVVAGAAFGMTFLRKKGS